MSYLMGIDVSTTGVKALLVDEHGVHAAIGRMAGHGCPRRLDLLSGRPGIDEPDGEQVVLREGGQVVLLPEAAE